MIRTCLGCHQRSEPGALVRLVAEDGQVVVDEGRRKAGRGAWVHRKQTCIERAQYVLAKALRVQHLDTSPVADWAAQDSSRSRDEKDERPMDNV